MAGLTTATDGGPSFCVTSVNNHFVPAVGTGGAVNWQRGSPMRGLILGNRATLEGYVYRERGRKRGKTG